MCVVIYNLPYQSNITFFKWGGIEEILEDYPVYKNKFELGPTFIFSEELNKSIKKVPNSYLNQLTFYQIHISGCI